MQDHEQSNSRGITNRRGGCERRALTEHYGHVGIISLWITQQLKNRVCQT